MCASKLLGFCYFLSYSIFCIYCTTQFTYEAHPSQFTFLRLMSSSVSQKLTFYCKNVVAVEEGDEAYTEKALRLLTMSGHELSIDGDSNERYNVIEDGCRVSSFLFTLYKAGPQTCQPVHHRNREISNFVRHRMGKIQGK